MIPTFSRQEWIADITLDTINREYKLPSGKLPMDRYLYGLLLEFEGRMTNPATGGPTGVLADAPYSLLDTIIVRGFHRFRTSSEEFINVKGPNARQWHRCFTIHAPYTTPATLSTTASATNDIRYVILIPFVPLGIPIRQQAFYLLDAPNYEGLELVIRYGDADSVFSGATTDPTFSAFNSATGNPILRVHGLFALGGPKRFAGLVPGRIWRYEKENSSSDVTASGSARRLFELPRGHRLRALMLKAGVKGTGVTGGNTSFSSLSDTILDDVKVYQGINKAIRHYTDMLVLQEEFATAYGLAPAAGFGLIDFAKHGAIGEALDTRGLIAGATGDVDLFIQSDVTGAANQAVSLTIEEIRGGPAQIGV